MGKIHKQYTPTFKAKLALEAIREESLHRGTLPRDRPTQSGTGLA